MAFINVGKLTFVRPTKEQARFPAPNKQRTLLTCAFHTALLILVSCNLSKQQMHFPLKCHCSFSSVFRLLEG
jgi:hypothetical protein